MCAHAHARALMNTGALRIQKRVLDPLQLELQAVASSPIWALGSRLKASPAPASSFIPVLLFLVGDLWLLVFDFFFFWLSFSSSKQQMWHSKWWVNFISYPYRDALSGELNSCFPQKPLYTQGWYTLCRSWPGARMDSVLLMKLLRIYARCQELTLPWNLNQSHFNLSVHAEVGVPPFNILKRFLG